MGIGKKSLTQLFIFSALAVQVKAQNYVVFGTDVYKDGLCAFYASGQNISYGDLGTVSYAFDVAQDSACFKIETYFDSPRNGDFGFYILIDKDNDLTNGINTGGGFGQCTGITTFNMKYDVIVQHSFNGNNVATNFSSSSLGVVTVQYVSNFVTIARTKLSLIDNNSDGNINFIVGLGGKNKEVYDIFPGTGYINTGASNIEEANEASSIKILNVPNPCFGINTFNYFLSKNSLVNVRVYDMSGKQVLYPVVNLESNQGANYFVWDAGLLQKGIYLFEITTQYGAARKKVIIQ